MTPAPRQPAAGDSDRAEWRQRLEDEIGEDPARYLDQPLLTPGTASDPIELIAARIRGLDRLARVSAWLAAERRLDRGPRDRVVSLLEQRRAYLQEHGERPEDIRTAITERAEDVPDRYWPRPVSDDLEKGEVTRYDEDGRPYRLVSSKWGLRVEYLDEADADADDSAAGREARADGPPPSHQQVADGRGPR